MSNDLTDLPEGWKLIRLDELFRWSNGKGLTKQQMEDGSYFVYGGNGITGTHSQWLCDESAIVVGRVGAHCGNVHLAQPHAWITDNAIYTSWKTNYVCLEFFTQLLANLKLNELAGGSGQPYVSQTILNPLLVPLPPLNEQKRIVAKIEELRDRHQAAKQALEAVPKLCDRFRQSVLAAAFRGDLTADWREENLDIEPASVLLERLRGDRRKHWEIAELEKFKLRGKLPKDEKWKTKYPELEVVDESDLPELPHGWCWAVAEEIVEPGADIVYGIVQPGSHIPDGVPYVRGQDIQDGKILLDQLLRTSSEIAERYARASLRGGDVLLGIIRATKVVIVPEELKGGNLTQGTARFRPSAIITTDYLASWLDSPYAQDWLHAHYRGIDMPGLNLRDVRRLPIPLAPLEEQMELSRVLSIAHKRRNIIQNSFTSAVEELSLLEQSILAKAFRGELVEQDLNDEPASVLLDRIRAEREQAGAKPKGKGKRGK